MNKSFKEAYKVTKNPIQMSYEMQLGLRQNEEYDLFTDNQCIEIINFFHKCYPKVEIEIPKKRKKTPKSIIEKSKNREIERLSKLYIIEGLNYVEIEELFSLFKIRIHENKELNSELIIQDIRELLERKIEDIDIEKFLQEVIVKGVSNSTKKALLRILRSKIEKNKIPKKEKQIDMLDEKYGAKAAKKSGKPEDNIIKYESIEEIRKDPHRIQLLHNNIEYLKSEDLMGMKIVIVNIPSDIKTNNRTLKKLISQRDKAKTSKERENYNDMAIQEIARDFINRLAKNNELLNKISAEIIPFSYKHKNKTNGYEAYHLKIRSINNPQYTLEIQAKSEYVENLCRGEGEASHENRPGKKRSIPSTKNEKEFLKQVRYTVPEYTLFKKENNEYKTIKCTMLENFMGYYEGLAFENLEEYERIVEIIERNNKKDRENIIEEVG